MMNKSKIDWCDFTWNPVTGCRRRCEYCYAKQQAQRFAGDQRINVTDPQLHASDGQTGRIYTLPKPFKNARGKVLIYPAGFEPTFHEYRLGDVARKKKPASIFVCSMADLFGPWVPDEWIERIFEACKTAPWHNYMFLTKYPGRYAALANAGKLPRVRECPNFWYGTTVTKAGDRAFTPGVIFNTFLSIEPISGPLDAGLGSFGGARWIIVGAETGNRKGKIAPERAWIENIIEAAAITHAPVLLKDSAELRAVWGDDLIQDFPDDLRPMSEDNSVPHCKECEEATKTSQGRRGNSYSCEIGWTAAGYDDRGARHIPGRYTRSCPPWCPKRKAE